MEELNQILLKIYLNNLNFLESEFPDIFKKVILLNEAIDNGQYKARWELEYKEDGEYFDLKNVESSDLFYNLNSYEQSNNVAQNVTFDNASSFDTLVRKKNSQEFLADKTYSGAKKLIEYISTITDFENIKFRKINKFVFLGSGLGLHISQVCEEIKPLNTFIIEPDLEIFRLSLFVTNYSNIVYDDYKLFLSIGEDETQRLSKISEFHKYHPYFNYNIKYHRLTNIHDNILEDFLNYISIDGENAIIIDFNLRTIKRTIQYAKEKYRFLNFNKIITNNNSLINHKPILIIAGGPSLDKNIDWIKKKQEEFNIISVNLMAKKLIDYGIKPNIIVAADPSEYVYGTISNIQDKDFYENTTIILASHVEERIIKLFNRNNIYFFQAMALFDKLANPEIGNNVGTVALAISLYLGAENIYIVGNDASFDNETGANYSSGSCFDTNTINQANDNRDTDVLLNSDILIRKGNFRDKVKTTRKLLNFKNSYETVMIVFSNSNTTSKVYNLSDGLFIEGMIPLKPENIIFQNKSRPDLDNSKLFKDISEVMENDNFLLEVTLFNQIKEKAYRVLKVKTNNINAFLNEKLKLSTFVLDSIKKMPTLVYINLYLDFLTVFDNYINFYLNIDKEQNKQEINILKNFWVNGIIELIDNIEKVLNQSEKSNSITLLDDKNI